MPPYLCASRFAPADEPTATPPPSVRRVMIIEDEPLVALELEMIVTDLGHQVVAIADTEAAAVAAAASEAPDLIVADVRLRSGTGIAAAERIARRHPLPVIIISGNADQAQLARTAPSLGNVRFLSKPFQVETLKDAIREALSGPA